MTNKEQLLDLIGNRTDMLPIIRDILAAERLTPKSYAQVFRLIYSTMAMTPDEQISFSKGAKEWRIGRRKLTDVKLFSRLGTVCDIIRYYVLASWDECIFSAWVASNIEVTKAEADMDKMESSSSLREIIKQAAEMMVYSTDGTIDWSAGDVSDEAVSVP